MAGINKVILVGNLGKDPDVRTVSSGAQVANFPIATSESYTNKEGQRVEKTEWHNIVVWRGLANIAEKYLKKGSKVYVEGKIRTRNYEDRDGVKKYITEIEVSDMLMLDKAGSGGGDGGYSGAQNYDAGNTGSFSDNTGGGNDNSNTNTPTQDDDLPF